MMMPSILLTVLLFLVAGSFQDCDDGFDLSGTNITTNMDRAKVFDTNYSNPEYVAMFQQDKAFCVIPHNRFHIQLDFKKIVTISIIKVQGFILNKESLMMSAFSLEFSIDGVKWYEYNYKTGAKYFVTKFTSDNGNSVTSHHLEKPIATMFMRLLPQQPTNSFSEKVCLRMKVFGCEKVFPPKVTIPPVVDAVISGSTTLTCLGTGTFGLSLGWDKNNMKSGPNPEKLYTIQEKVTKDVVTKLTDLVKLKCKIYPKYLTCVRPYTCYGSYHFAPSAVAEKHTTMVLQVYFPEQPRTFRVKSRTKGSVILAWETPNMRNLTVDMLEYVIKCSHNNLTEEILPITVNEMTIRGLGIYKPYWCALKVQLKNSTFPKFPFRFSQESVILNFHSSTLRPDLNPKMKLKIKSPTEIEISIPPVKFERKEYGIVGGYLIRLDLLRYGDKGKVAAYFRNDQLWVVKRINDPNIRNYTLKVFPWSLYRVTLSIFNNDDLASNTTHTDIRMPEGVPRRGMTLVGFNIKKTWLVIQTAHLKKIYRSGIIIKFETVINPGPNNKTVTHTKEIFEIQNLKPNTLYTLRCRAATKAGFGPFGPPFSIRTAEDIPSAPLDVHLVGDINSVKKDWHIVWTKPETPNGNITAYGVEMELRNGSIVRYETNHEVTHYHVENTPKDAVKKISVRARTKPGWGPRSNPYYPTEDRIDPRSENLNNVVLVVALVFAVVFLLILICLCFVMNRRRTATLCVRDSMKEVILPRESTSSAYIEADEETFERINLLTRNRSESVGTGNHNIINHSRNPIKVEEFVAYMNSMKADDYGVLCDEFKSVSSGQCSPCQVADFPENKDKNRYVDIKPYDHSRVLLQTGEGRKSDYINASYVKSFSYETGNTFRYISSQGPLDNTQNDFWTMIWQEEVRIIVMLTNLVENGRTKCSKYWPNESAEYGDLVVTLEKIDKTADYVTRYFKVDKPSTEESRVVLQFHFVSWPDHGVPDYPTAILSLRRRIRHSYDPSKPMVVHCSAGVGRSGCFILIDAMLERIDHDKTVDVFNFLRYSRSRRINMVQTFEQYRLAHTAILEYIIFGNTEIFLTDFDNRVRQLGKNNGMAEEFELLTTNTTPVPSTGNPCQVLLRDQFIDAYYVDGYKQRDGFIITKAATKNNAGDFWKMVLDKQCHTIVMLNKCQEPTQEYFKYWPDVDNHCVYEDTTVLTTSEVANGNIITRKIKVTTNKRKCEVYHFQYVDWPSADIPHRRGYTNICTLMQTVERSQQNLGNGPIIVHGGNGYGRSGTFISIYNSTERLKVEQLIDVLQCVRAIRISQPLAVDNITQYQFVYKMLRTYLEGFENYWNYKDYKVTRSPLGSTST